MSSVAASFASVNDDSEAPSPQGEPQPAATRRNTSHLDRTRYHRQMRAWLQALVLLTAEEAFARPPAKLVTVVTDDWTATHGELRRWERSDGKSWRPVGEPVPVVVGKAGLGWGEGVRARPAEGPDKREGDGRSPAGAFALGDITGYGDIPGGLRLAYRKATPALRCVDDPAAAAYNTLAEAPPSPAAPAWRSDEKMLRDDELYRFTVFVRLNPARTPGHGSCIFLHVWHDADSPTVGCTAMALAPLRALLLFIDPATVLVQLPRAAYGRLQRAWGLPPIQRK
jgi:L,D-peptidoglycan transpeptidase YkuD (ErfK/YbiS/YcfS/YnhG family)